ncbi:hypothetical protein [Chroococcidiopsis sp. CCALA 051]|uniref:hypothetical protein n=1 Tax=Chroococcidiopsis sp. CCALA 051 TaxID=869949 RepID=UPI001304B27E|nr:hypothetical protein [Chroococcidiopsis sp. CCALA 051]
MLAQPTQVAFNYRDLARLVTVLCTMHVNPAVTRSINSYRDTYSQRLRPTVAAW